MTGSFEARQFAAEVGAGLGDDVMGEVSMAEFAAALTEAAHVDPTAVPGPLPAEVTSRMNGYVRDNDPAYEGVEP